MDVYSNLEIHFHDQDQASVVLETNGGPHEQFGEILAFCLYSLRQLVNLGMNEASQSLGALLARAGPALRELAHHESPGGAKLVPYQGAPGRKRFLARLRCSSEHVDFHVKAKGFGLLGRGVAYYVPNSIQLLLRYLARRRIDNDKYIECLGMAATKCGEAFLSGALSVTNHHKTAWAIASGTWAPVGSTDAPLDKRPEAVAETSPGGDVLSILRGEGPRLNTGDLAKLFEPGGTNLAFRELDPATRMVFDHIVREQADVVRAHLPKRRDAPDQRSLMMEVGMHVYDGFIVGRRLLTTHKRKLSYSPDSAQAQKNAEALLTELGRIKGVDLLEEAGGDALQFLENWGVINYRGGVYQQMGDAERAATLSFVAALNGFALAIGEHVAAAQPP